jgi:ABC-2 type transport system ATP-binding protein
MVEPENLTPEDVDPVSARNIGAATAPLPAVRFRRVSKSYGGVAALNGIDLDIESGGCVCLLGPNGAGKSTAIGLMLGILEPSAGEATVFGASPRQAVARGRIGSMLQAGRMPSGVTVGELVDFTRRLYPTPLSLDEALERAGLTSKARRRTEDLSGGEAQRLRFALAIAGDPDLLFLDEPTVSMDVESRVRFWDDMDRELTKGRTVLFATHYLEEANQHADRVVILSQGQVVADGTPGSLRSKTRMVRFTLKAVDRAALAALPGVAAVQVEGQRVELQTSDPEATVKSIYAADLPIRDLEVGSQGLEAAFLDLVGSGQ